MIQLERLNKMLYIVCFMSKYTMLDIVHSLLSQLLTLPPQQQQRPPPHNGTTHAAPPPGAAQAKLLELLEREGDGCSSGACGANENTAGPAVHAGSGDGCSGGGENNNSAIAASRKLCGPA